MGKYFLISFDDGALWDGKLVKLLNRHGLKGTFNLNSGLENFVWDFQGFPVYRQRLADTVTQYQGHEIASHSLHHPNLEGLPDEQLLWQVGEDCANLKRLFGLRSIGFAVPFTHCSEHQIRLLRPGLRYLRLSEFTGSFALPQDAYHIPVHALYNQSDVRQRIAAFAADPGPHGLFVLAGHSYELEALGQWDYLEDLLSYIGSFGFENMTTMEFAERFYSQEGVLCL